MNGVIQIYTPLVSVIITTFQRPTMLPQDVESVLKQDYPAMEIIISDDASQDHTPSVASALTAIDSRVRYNRNQENLGEGMNVNYTVGTLAQGKYFAVMQDDAQYIDPQFIRMAVEVMEQYPKVSFVAGCLEGTKNIGDIIVPGREFWRGWPMIWRH